MKLNGGAWGRRHSSPQSAPEEPRMLEEAFSLRADLPHNSVFATYSSPLIPLVSYLRLWRFHTAHGVGGGGFCIYRVTRCFVRISAHLTSWSSGFNTRAPAICSRGEVCAESMKREGGASCLSSSEVRLLIHWEVMQKNPRCLGDLRVRCPPQSALQASKPETVLLPLPGSGINSRSTIDNFNAA